ncbi:IF-3 binds to the 30S ribosomal subunit and shifts the equilibrum between 70S ribosomes and their 50S and 30S subunits in favor of the free subunits [Seminavis robusta]|uniref:IF-3 binds to the 30S ribosomal subunit and shifts the equilibrum between 70S ribosomes and their 50S and 30S subunits in favor of the free subunits n=1 Tax=Seminavis robusta TaxID=568900 RepID=A0A9N8DES8_9STRA|nr:IF-3 binds to the 30S ribosomal subunit and shifts the equilibrum between 70S ribosomes and their 50S and 30S subunits in favor of the free subunits [Seminavis robusta]|eukprot:Sro109_g054560.1 IF-3 binds to the 30S ribosomal subunit and shifts the equilibrum between 70S ribosomes and their 50S and 30S subunits in favor of the free subunits (267) ;mRNA; r:63811-64611
MQLPTATSYLIQSNNLLSISRRSLHTNSALFSVWESTVSNYHEATAITTMTTRGMTIKRKKARPKTKESQENLPLMNERLVKAIMKKSRASDPKSVKLRLVVEMGGDTPPTSQETTLSGAITISVDHGLDLVEINLNGLDLPVVRAVQYEAKMYRANKEKAAKVKANADSSIVKEFRFRAKTADHDLQRKLGRVQEALEKGQRCKLSCTCASRMIRNNQEPLGAAAVIDRILQELESVGDPVSPPTVNKEKTHGTVTIAPKQKKKG